MNNLSSNQLNDLKFKANKIRTLVIKSICEAKSGHPAGSLGMADVFSAMYFYILNHDPKNPELKDRDRLILSNGHICPVQYASLALSGYFPVGELKTLRKINSRLQGHPHRGSLPGIETTSGPLGEGLSQAIGIALARDLDKKSYYVYCLTSDGEHQEGNIWEAVMFAAKYKLKNFIQIIDRNYIQIDGSTEDVMPLDSLKSKYKSFNWNAIEVDGNNIEEFIDVIENTKKESSKPSVIIAKTIPGKGIKFMEGACAWHGKAPSKDEAEKAIKELEIV